MDSYVHTENNTLWLQENSLTNIVMWHCCLKLTMVRSWHGNSLCFTGPLVRGMDSPYKGPVMLTFDVFFAASLKKLLNKWFSIPWQLCDAIVMWQSGLIPCMVHALIARFTGPTWGPSGAYRTQEGPMLAPWTLLSGWQFLLAGHMIDIIVTQPYNTPLIPTKWVPVHDNIRGRGHLTHWSLVTP